VPFFNQNQESDMSNLNVSNTTTASSAATATFKSTNDQQKTTNDFKSTLVKEIQVGEFTDLKMKMEDGKVIELKNRQRVHIEPMTVESEQKRLGVSKTEAEVEFAKMKADWNNRGSERLIALKKSAEHMTPEGMKKYLMSKEVKAVARDAEGNIVAKLYKDGSFYSTDDLANITSEFRDGRSAEQAMQKIEKQPNVFVTHYQSKVTDFDLMSEGEKQRVLSPEFNGENRQSILKEIAELEWSMAYGVGNGLSPLFGPHAADAAAISHDVKNFSNGTDVQLKGYSAPDMLTAEEKASFAEMKKQGNLSDEEIGKMIGALAMDRFGEMTTDPGLEKNYTLDLEGYYHLTGATVPSLDANYLIKLMRESHISNTMASEISQKSLSVALTYISQHPINNET
jgi:hypothetical protein